ncbi:Type IV pilus biogenesis protein PilN [Chitinispirillum alkaliphilum]|nr:Type IV pilus biogenesis protein PilN [Chitinispirillum alkaliphilum]
MIERIEINLLPAEYRVHTRKMRLTRDVVYPVLALIVLAVAGAVYSMMVNNELSQLEADIQQINNSIRQNQHIQNEINSLRRDKREIDEKIVALERINVNREKWVRLMEIFSQRLPGNTFLLSIREEPGSRLRVEGRTFVFPEVADYMSRLKEEDYISAVELSDIEQINPRTREYRFAFACHINADAMLTTSP